MSNNTHLSIVNSARFLSRIYVGENWVWFLSKNMHGLSAYPTIPFDNSLESLTYDMHDLKAFAFLYGRGQRSEHEISSHADEHLKLLAIEDLAVGTRTEIVPMGDFMSPYETTDTDYFQLSSGELNALRDRIDLLTNTQSFMIEVLESLAKDILSIGRQGMPTGCHSPV